MVTPSYQQGAYVEATLLSVLQQNYPRLSYGIQDGGSTDATLGILQRHRDQATFVEVGPDGGQTDALIRGFRRLDPQPEDIMAWLNSDDQWLPGTLARVNDFFIHHPDVDAVFGHRIVIDSASMEVGRWWLPEYIPDVLRWHDFIPQETLFFRASAYQKVGGLDPDFHFAMDWDLLLRLQAEGCTIRRMDGLAGCFRLHTEQKTSRQIHTIGESEIQRLRSRHLPAGFTREDVDAVFWREVRRSRRDLRRSGWSFLEKS